MVVFPNCKINIGLNVTGKRFDGYHELETVFYPVPLYDAVEIIEDKNGVQTGQGQYSVSGLQIGGGVADNLCVKAYQLLKKDFPDLPSVMIHLHKAIPIGAGLGGGSADGASTLKLINKKFHLELSEAQLISYALQLGSDCPFFIINKPSIGSGRGEILEPAALTLSAFNIVIVHPFIHISTAWAFTAISPCKPAKQIKNIIQQPIETWKEELKNDFEEPVFNRNPEIRRIKDSLYDAGAVYASMTGSGSTVYGIFEKAKTPSISFPKNYFVKTLDS